MASRIDIYVSCSQEEALRRIAEGAPWLEFKDYFSLTTPKERCLAKVSGNTFLLRYLSYLRNSFAPDGNGFVEPTGQGARIHVIFGMHPIVVLLNIAWFGGLAAINLFVLVAWLAGLKLRGDRVWLLPLISLVMVMFGGGLLYIGVRLGRKDEAAMIRFLNSLFADVRLSDPPSPEPSPKP